MFNKNKLKGKIIECGYSMEQIAGFLGIDPVTLYRKMSQETEFTRNEIATLKTTLNLTLQEMDDIFFCSETCVNATNERTDENE